LFFPIGSTGPALLQIEEAKAVCRRCPVVSECLSWALDSGQDAGVWGGMSEDERCALKRRPRRPERTPVEVIADLAARGSSDPEIAHTLGGDWTAPRVAETRRTAGIPAGRYVLQDAA
jgi:WhiB family redox-sensing transcriptional regulator